MEEEEEERPRGRRRRRGLPPFFLASTLVLLLGACGLPPTNPSAHAVRARRFPVTPLPWDVPWEDPVGDRPLVRTRNGLLRGFTKTVPTGKFVDAFLGVPYAQPPLGAHRFRHPQPAPAWKGELMADKLPNSCYQVNDTFFGSHFSGTNMWNANTPLSEDCLYLNVWAPFGTVLAHSRRTLEQPPVDMDAKMRAYLAEHPRRGRPVMVWIYGGGFYSGTSSLELYDGGVLATEEDVVVVSFNYRVSSLGFLYLNQSSAPGNAGLFDQLLALKWVHDNIDQFGGDPDRVTLFGESAGAVSASYHLLSPLSRNLFRRVLLQSGAPVCEWCLQEPMELVANSVRLAQKLNCPVGAGNHMNLTMECLLRADPRDLVSQRVGRSGALINFPFAPVVDGLFLPEHPEQMLKHGLYQKADLLLGSNENEGNSWLIYLADFIECQPATATNHQALCRPKEQLSMRRSQFERLVGEELVAFAQSPLVKQAMLHEYTNWSRHPLDSYMEDNEGLDKIVGDYYFTCPVNSFGQFWADHGNRVFMYHFEHRSSISPWPEWMGVLHGDEISYIFGEPLNPSLHYSRSEVDLSKRMMKYWANFARDGNPTIKSLPDGQLLMMEEDWPVYSRLLQHYFQLRADGFGLGVGLRTRSCAFWADVVNEMKNYTNKCESRLLAKEELGHEPNSSAQLNSPIMAGQHQFNPGEVTPLEGAMYAVGTGLFLMALMACTAWCARWLALRMPADRQSSSVDVSPVN